MEPNKETVFPRAIDWKWVGVGYCLFVVFHLLPSYLLLEFVRYGMGGSVVRSVWVLAGLLVIGVYIGYRSRGVTIIEPAVAAVLYVFTLFLTAGDVWGRSPSARSIGILFLFSVIAFFLALGGAWIGEMLQARKENKEESQTSR